MRTTIDISKTFNLKKIKFDLSKEINKAAQSIVKDHDKRLQHGQGIDGRPMAKLKASTIHSKRDKGYSKPRVPLYATGTMKNIRIAKKANQSSQEARLTPAKSRKEIGVYHQSGIRPHVIKPRQAKMLYPIFNSRGEKFGAKKVNHPGTPPREWFGVTKKVEKELLRGMRIKIDRILKNA